MKRLVFFLLPAFGLLSAQAQSPPDTTMQALLTEVRQLRLALEKSNAVLPRIQVTLQRMQLQQDAVSRASRELDEARALVSKSAAEQEGMSGHARAMESLAGQEQDAARRKELEREAAASKSMVDQQRPALLELQARESEKAGRLQTEQARLNELNDQLNVLERTLDIPQTK
jgi:hypothetical protein